MGGWMRVCSGEGEEEGREGGGGGAPPSPTIRLARIKGGEFIIPLPPPLPPV